MGVLIENAQVEMTWISDIIVLKKIKYADKVPPFLCQVFLDWIHQAIYILIFTPSVQCVFVDILVLHDLEFYSN